MEKYKIIVIDEEGKESLLAENGKIENLNILTNDVAENNIIKIHKPIRFAKGCTLDLRCKGMEIILNSTKYTYNFNLLTATGARNNKLYVGKNCSMWTGISFNLTEDNAQLYIGDDCMFSKNVEIWASDGHAIIDLSNKEPKVVNTTRSETRIGNHTWIGTGVKILKEVVLGNNVVVGSASVVTRSFEKDNIVVAGNPARCIRENCTWDRKRPLQYEYALNQNILKDKKKIIAIIPARYQSSRFPGKPLSLILGKPMIQWVYERVSSLSHITEVYVATDEQRIFDVVETFGGKAIMTGECTCGTDRVYQACKDIDADIILNIQGDEPMIKTEMIEDLISAFNDSEVKMATLKKEIISESDINNPNIAKLITDENSNAVYFSRSTIPYNRDGRDDIKYYKHIGVYGYTKEFLKTFVNLPQSSLEKAEQLEQLRAIENGYKIRVIETKYQSIGVDLPEHVAIVEEEIKREQLIDKVE